MVVPGSTAVWLPGLGDRWPQHSRLCLLSTHAHLSFVSWWGVGMGPASAPTTKSRACLQPLREPRALSWAQPPLPNPCTRLKAPSSPNCEHPQTSQLASACPTFHAQTFTMLTPHKGFFEWVALSTPLAVPKINTAQPVFGAADMTACHVYSPKASREDNLLSVAAQLLQSPCLTHWPPLSPREQG